MASQHQLAQLGSYRLLRRIGHGGFGLVYEAEHQTLRRRDAVKVIPLFEQTDRSEQEERSLREGVILGRLEHPGIARAYDANIVQTPNGRLLYIAMELVEGQPLDAWLDRDPAFAERLRVFREVCHAVAHAHGHGVLHLDLKPQNIMVREDGRAVVLDFGIARELGNPHVPSAPASRTAVQGTRGYLAPEQLTPERTIGPPADIYALGRLLERLCASADPSADRNQATEVAKRAMAENPKDRPRTVADVLHALPGQHVALPQRAQAAAIGVGVLCLGAAAILALSPVAADPRPDATPNPVSEKQPGTSESAAGLRFITQHGANERAIADAIGRGDHAALSIAYQQLNAAVLTSRDDPTTAEFRLVANGWLARLASVLEDPQSAAQIPHRIVALAEPIAEHSPRVVIDPLRHAGLLAARHDHYAAAHAASAHLARALHRVDPGQNDPALETARRTLRSIDQYLDDAMPIADAIAQHNQSRLEWVASYLAASITTKLDSNFDDPRPLMQDLHWLLRALTALDRTSQAYGWAQHAISLADNYAGLFPVWECLLRVSIAEVLLGSNEPAAAERQLALAEQLAVEHGRVSKHERARLLLAAGRASHALGRTAEAAEHISRARDLLAEASDRARQTPADAVRLADQLGLRLRSPEPR